jgi:hypothetical protein
VGSSQVMSHDLVGEEDILRGLLLLPTLVRRGLKPRQGSIELVVGEPEFVDTLRFGEEGSEGVFDLFRSGLDIDANKADRTGVVEVEFGSTQKRCLPFQSVVIEATGENIQGHRERYRTLKVAYGRHRL